MDRNAADHRVTQKKTDYRIKGAKPRAIVELFERFKHIANEKKANIYIEWAGHVCWKQYYEKIL